MDFGFSGIKSFEEYLGKRTTKALAILVGLALAAFSMRILWDNLVHPLLQFLQTPLWGQTMGNLLWALGTIILGVAGGLQLATALNRWRAIRQLRMAKADIERIEKVFAETKELRDSNQVLNDRSEKIVDTAFDVLELALPSAKKWIEANPELTNEQRAEMILQLQDQWSKLRTLREEDGRTTG